MLALPLTMPQVDPSMGSLSFCVFAGEGKNVGCGSGSNRLRDVGTFCTISLDQEEVFRTKVYEKSLSPFYGEDFYFEIPRPFQCLSFHVYAKSVFQREQPVGKVSIRKDDLCKYSGKEHWFALQPVDPNSEVQGKVHLEMKLNELITDNGPVSPRLQVRIIECQGLPLISGQNCDSFATVTLIGPARSDQRKTKVKKKTSDPHFEETFYFEVMLCVIIGTLQFPHVPSLAYFHECPVSSCLLLEVELWNNGNLAQDVFLGETRVSLKVLRNDVVHKAWYLLQPRGNGTKPKPDDLGSLRLNVTYTEDNVLPSSCYFPLRNLLLKSPDVQPISASAAHILGDVLNTFIEANTIFRGNSLATRCIDDMMKMVGRNYLTVTLKPVLDEICESNKTCEIDPVKLKEGDNVEVNKENLQVYVQKVFSSITQSSASCPPLMCDVFRALRQLASDRFPGDPHVQYSAVSSFVFLRFFAVAVLSPHTFQLRPHHPVSVFFLSVFLKKMFVFFNVFFFSCLPNLTVRNTGRSFLEVHKRAQGKKRLGKKNFKKRWLRVTNRELSYHKHKGKDALCVIPVKNILGVEKLDENTFNRKNMFQVLLSERPLYVQAGNCVEASEWIEVLSQVSRCNPGRLSNFHPSAYVTGMWLCCKETTENLPGCRPCTTTLANIQPEIDCDRETERIFSLFSASLPRLQKMEDACASMSVYLGQQKEQEEYSAFIIQDPKETFRTIKEIREVLEEDDQQNVLTCGPHRDSKTSTHTHYYMFIELLFTQQDSDVTNCYQMLGIV
uniref:RAS p21 protein activator 2 n=1 Tax=Pygocentrus nattereri TaxID=42514 RepID=A0AAR2L2N3_PYGNA